MFSGKFTDWATFKDMFIACVHTNDRLTPIKKFFHLRSSLTGDAANCIRNFETTAINYEHTWATVNARYNNEKLLIQSHVKDICELNEVKENPSDSLRIFSDTLSVHIAALEALKQRPKDWGPLLIHIICTKLDTNTLTEWEMKAPKNAIAKVEELIIFLNERSQTLEAVESSKNIVRNIKYATEIKNSVYKKNKDRTASTAFTTTTDISCFICNLQHTIYKCPTFISSSVNDRIKKVSELGLCKLCLRKHDLKRKCMSRNCFKCGKTHNTLLHIIQYKTNEGKSTTEEKRQTEVNTSTTAHAHCIKYEQVLLSTAIVQAFGDS